MLKTICYERETRMLSWHLCRKQLDAELAFRYRYRCNAVRGRLTKTSDLQECRGTKNGWNIFGHVFDPLGRIYT